MSDLFCLPFEVLLLLVVGDPPIPWEAAWGPYPISAATTSSNAFSQPPTNEDDRIALDGHEIRSRLSRVRK